MSHHGRNFRQDAPTSVRFEVEKNYGGFASAVCQSCLTKSQGHFSTGKKEGENVCCDLSYFTVAVLSRICDSAEEAAAKYLTAERGGLPCLSLLIHFSHLATALVTMFYVRTHVQSLCSFRMQSTTSERHASNSIPQLPFGRFKQVLRHILFLEN